MADDTSCESSDSECWARHVKRHIAEAQNKQDDKKKEITTRNANDTETEIEPSSEPDLEQGYMACMQHDRVKESSKEETSGTRQDEQDMSVEEENSDPSLLSEKLDYFVDDFGTILVPPAGQPLSDDKQQTPTDTTLPCQYRPYSNGCPICLSAFAVDDEISWSHNPHCSHVFHTACIHAWLAAAGRKHMKRQQRHMRHHRIVLQQDPITTILQMPLICPCCRQYFLLNDDEAKAQLHKKGGLEQPTETQSADVEEASNVIPSASVVQEIAGQSLSPSSDSLSVPAGTTM